MHISLCCPSSIQGDESHFNVDITMNLVVFNYFAWSLRKTTDETKSRKRKKYDRYLRHNMSYYKNSIKYSTTGFNFITDEELKPFVSVFGIFLFDWYTQT